MEKKLDVLPTTITALLFAGVILALLIAFEAHAANYWLARVTGPTGVYCAPRAGTPLAISCSEGTTLAFGFKISDGGTRNESDAGEPLAASAVDQVIRPLSTGDSTIPINLTNNEQCIAIKVQSGDAGTCDFYKRSVQ